MWLLPTLNRSKLVQEFIESYKESESTTPVMLLVDESDPDLENYKTLNLPEKFTLKLTKSVTMGDKIREVWDEILKCEWVGILNDDHRPRTKGWDQVIVSQLNGANIAFTNDGPTPDKPYAFPNKICGAIAFSGKVLKTLGYMFPPGVQHLFSDDAWGYLFGNARAAIALGNVCVEHDHAYKKPELQDETFKLINGPQGLVNGQGIGGLWPKDREAFQKWLETQAQDDLQKIIDIQPKMGIMLATPAHDGLVSINYAMGLSDTSVTLNQQGTYFEHARVIGSSLICHARNSLADMFLKSRCQKLLFIDADQGFNRDAVFRLFVSSRRIIAGITPHKRFPMNLNFEPLEKHYKYFKDLNNKSVEEFQTYAKECANEQGEIEVARSGTGFMCIDRSVFEMMKEHVPEYFPFDHNEKVRHREYFKMGASNDGRYRGEDWLFCDLAKKLSLPIYINIHSFVSHQGQHVYAA